MKAGSSAGIFSIDFRDKRHGVIVGGDYTKEGEATDNLAITKDGGVTWTLQKGLTGYRSVVAYVPRLGNKTRTLVATGPSGTDYSVDDGGTWQPVKGPGFDTLSFVRISQRGGTGWAAGNSGAIGKMTIK